MVNKEKEDVNLVKALDLIINGGGKSLNEKMMTESSPAMPYSYGVESDTGHDLNIRNYLLVVRKRWKLILSLTLFVTAIVAIMQARKPDIYEAKSQLLINPQNENSPIAPKEAPIYNLNDPVYFNTQTQILSSPVLLRRVAKTLDLENNKSFYSSQAPKTTTWQRLQKMMGFGGGETPQQTPDPNNVLTNEKVAQATPSDDLKESEKLAPYVGIISGGLTIERVIDNQSKSFSKETRLVNVRYQSTDPMLAAKIVNTVADTYVLHNLEQRTSTTNSTKDYLAQRVAQLQAEIKQGEEQLMNYTRNNPTLAANEAQNTVVEKLVWLNRQLLEARNKLTQAEAAYKAAQGPGAVESLTEQTNKLAADNEAKLSALKQKREELMAKYTQDNPKVIEIDKQIVFLEKAIKDAKQNTNTNALKRLETEYLQAKSVVEKLQADFNKQKAETMTQNEAAINYRIIQQEIETKTTLLNSLLKSSGETDVVRAGTPNNVSVTDYALIPKSPIGPQRSRTVGLTFMMALAGSIIIALFLEFLNDTVASVDDVEKKLHLPALGVIPQIGGKSKKSRKLSSSKKLAKSNGNGSKAIMLTGDRASQISEAYRHLRTSVLLSTAGGAPKSLLISSSVPAEGKTTTAVNTAISLAQTGVSVVIVDADMRRPRLHKIFEKNNERGLSTILSRKMEENEILNLVQQHPGTGLYVLPSGPIPPNPAELIGSDQMRKLLNILTNHFTHIIVDSPPIASFTDSVLISAMVDGTLLVVQAGKTSMSVVKRTKQILQDVGGRIFGVVLNNMSVQTSEYYYYQRYYSTYYDRDEDD
jgi:capsular exopolysaccharide synthesis family protein